MKKHALILLAVALVGCDTVADNEPDDLMVIEAFLFTGQPVEDVRITEAIPLNSLVEGDTLEVPVSDAAVVLRRGNETFPLTSTGSDGYYRYDGDDLAVAPGETFVLEASRNGQSVSAETTVPSPPVSVALSTDTIEIPRLVLGFGPPDRAALEASAEGLRNARVSVSWANPNSDLHFVVVEGLVDGEPDYILPDFIQQRIGAFRQVEQPTDSDLHEVDLRNMETYGDYRVMVFRVNKEYADLYSGLEQDSRDLNEPPSNISGGLGVFSAFSGTSASFQVLAVEAN